MTTPVLIAHRGASGLRPEHTLEAYRLGLELGADAFDLDLVATLDGHLVARHEPELSRTTDIARRPEFSHLRTTKVIDGRAVDGWFADDLTLVELRTLRAVERMPDLRPDNASYDGLLHIPTLDEALDLAEAQALVLGRDVAVYVELKHETWHAARGLRLAQLTADTLAKRPSLATAVMSFEVSGLMWLRKNTDLRLAQLVDAGGMPFDRATAGDVTSYRDMVAPRGLMHMAGYADAVVVAKNLVLPRRVDGSLAEPSHIVGDAHAAGLRVGVWTLRNENDFLPAGMRSSNHPAGHGHAIDEYRAFMAVGADLLIGDHVESGVRARQSWAGASVSGAAASLVPLAG